MDLTVNNYPQNTPTFAAHWNRQTKKAILNGILKEVRKQPRWYPDPAKGEIGGEALFNKLSDKAEKIEEMLAAKFGRGTFALHNESGLSPVVSKITFWDGRAFYNYDIPETIQKEIKVVNKSNFLRMRFKIAEFPADRLDWLYDFLSKLK